MLVREDCITYESVYVAIKKDHRSAQGKEAISHSIIAITGKRDHHSIDTTRP
jgi:hypothetical protein